MKRKLNLIASATSLIILGLPATSNAYQHDGDALVGSGVFHSEARQADELPVSAQSPVLTLSPLEMPKLKGSVNATTRPEIQQISAMEDISPSVRNGVPPIVRASQFVTKQEGVRPATAAPMPPIIKASGRRVRPGQAVSQVQTADYPPIVKSPIANSSINQLAYESASVERPAARVASARPKFVPQGSATRTPLPSIEAEMELPNSNGYASAMPESPEMPVQDYSAGQLPTTVPVDVQTPDYFSSGNGYGEAPVIDAAPCESCAPMVANDGGCATCGTGMTDGVCPTCGPGAGYSNGPVIQDFGTFGTVSASRSYAHAEALFMTREDGDIFGTNIAPLTNFDTTGGLRLTLGRKQDSVFGREVGFMILNDVSQDVTILNNPALNVDFQSQNKESDLYSLEFNRVSWGWDLVKAFAGVRFIRFDDSYRISANTAARGPQPAVLDVFGNTIRPASVGRPAGSGLSTIDASNSLFGAHLGGELFYDIGYRWSASIGSKFGVYANLNDFDTNTFVNSAQPFSAENDGATVSTSADLSFLAHYQVRTNLRLKLGYNLMYIGNVATVSDNFIQRLPTLGGVASSDSDDVFFHGFSLGLEFYR